MHEAIVALVVAVIGVIVVIAPKIGKYLEIKIETATLKALKKRDEERGPMPTREIQDVILQDMQKILYNQQNGARRSTDKLPEPQTAEHEGE